MPRYNWELPDWPHFTYTINGVSEALFAFAEKAGRINGLLEGLPANLQIDVITATMVAEAMKTSEIEGEYMSRKDVYSSIRNHLGWAATPEPVADKRAAGIGHLMAAVRNSYADLLTEATLFQWHQLLLSYTIGINTGGWRTHNTSMQVVSGALGSEVIHFEAPPSARVQAEMQRFLHWFNEGPHSIATAPLRAAIAHLWFESIHPFEDGNGRIGRAIAEKALAQGLGRPVLLSLSRSIEHNRKAYYEALKTAQQSNEITGWVTYFTHIILQAQEEAEQQVAFLMQKAKYLARHQDALNARQLKVVLRMLEEGPEGFEGGMNARKYGSITQVSKATATRDLQDLVEKGAVTPTGGGRSISYALCF